MFDLIFLLKNKLPAQIASESCKISFTRRNKISFPNLILGYRTSDILRFFIFPQIEVLNLAHIPRFLVVVLRVEYQTLDIRINWL